MGYSLVITWPGRAYLYGQAEPYPYPGHPNTKNGTRAFHIHNDLHGTYLILKKYNLR